VFVTALYFLYSKSQKKLKDLLEAKENFIAGFSHEVRNPLNSMIGNIELAKASSNEPEVKKLLQNARSCSEVLLSMINNILDNEKAQQGIIEIQKSQTLIRDLMERIWSIFSPMIS